MKKTRLLESLTREVGGQVAMRRYSLAEMISESYKLMYECDPESNFKKLAESHLSDVKQNPREIERLSRQLSILKEISKLTESGDLKDEDLVDKKAYDTVEPKKERVIQAECNEAAGDWEAFKKSEEYDEAYANWKDYMREEGHSGPFDEDEFEPTSTCNDAYKRWQKNNTVNESKINESDDTDLTDEELEELAKHLETIRKERKEAPKTEMKEDAEPAAPARRGIKCHMADSKKPEKEDLDEEVLTGPDGKRRVYQLSMDIYAPTDFDPEEMFYTLENDLDQAGMKLVGHNYEISWSKEEYEEKVGYDLDESKKEEEVVEESKTYAGLENFKKQSESKAFYKTFKKMNDTLKEGKALTRQESIDLYKASNSALTQLSIELEHNPEFLDTFKESVSVLSKDVTSLLESLTRGKAPSKKTMQSLAKFSEALLCESEDLHNDGDYTVYRDDDGNLKARDRRTGDDVKFDKKELIATGRVKVNEADEDDDEDLDDIEVDVDDTEESPVEDEVSDEEIPTGEETPEETPEEDFVGDDEGDIASEEADEFDQEYADARVELHKELEAEHADDEDPAVQEKIAQDAEDVMNLPGITDEQIAELNGEEVADYAEEEAPEEPEGEAIEDEPEEEESDDSEITDDELAELKSHLKEMRAAKKENRIYHEL